jgi:hypothetical protein
MVIPPRGDATDGGFVDAVVEVSTTASEFIGDFTEEVSRIVNEALNALEAIANELRPFVKPPKHYAKAMEHRRPQVVFVLEVRCRGPTGRVEQCDHSYDR